MTYTDAYNNGGTDTGAFQLLEQDYRATFRVFTEQEAIFETLAASDARPDEIAKALKALDSARLAHSAARDRMALSLFALQSQRVISAAAAMCRAA
jgi:hypothetical protein